MTKRATVTILTDNTAHASGLLAEHGLSMWITVDGLHILFDTGMGNALLTNAAALGVDLRSADALVLSHGHYDHSGGIPQFLSMAAHPRILMHPSATMPRYGCLQSPPHKPIGMPDKSVEALSGHAEDITYTTGPVGISRHAWVTGPIPRCTMYEDSGGPLFVDEECRIGDSIMDDQAMWLDTLQGIVVLLGCAHAGVVNTLDYIAKLTGATAIYAVIGGMHLLNTSDDRLKETAEAFVNYHVQLLAPCHCTGEGPIGRLAAQFPAICHPIGAGAEFAWFL